MRSLIASLMFAVLFPQVSSLQVAAQEQTKKPARFQDVLYDVRAFSNRLKKSDSDREKIDAIVDLCTLYLHIISDSRFSRSQVLQGYRGRIANRLRIEQKPIKRNLKEESKFGSSSFDSEESNDRLVESIVDRNWRLLSHASGGAVPTMYHSSGMFGTPGYFWRGRAGGLIGDNGQELVDLIEAILHPDFWQPNGGVGTVYYYRPLRILVVRATTTVHEDLERFLEMLR